MMDKYALITAGGSGSRMKSSIPKQFLLLNNKPVLMHTINIFLKFCAQIKIVLVLPTDQIPYWESLCKTHHFKVTHTIVEGGPSRYLSVKNGLKQIPEEALVAIHDGVRPLVSLETIGRCFHFAERFGNAIPVININDSVRIVDGPFSKIINRDELRLVQTPQVFHSSLIKKAYQETYKESFTDDASVLESIHERIYLVEGNQENIKITTPFDLELAHLYLNKVSDKEDTYSQQPI